MIEFWLVFMLGFLFFMGYLYFRTNYVYNKRLSLLQEVVEISKAEIRDGNFYNWHWRFDRLENYSYTKMFWQLQKFNWTLEEVLQ